MGRVYNALVRAERWKEGNHPIGGPVRTGWEAGQREGAQVLSSPSASSTAAQFAVEDGFTVTEQLASPVSGQPLIAAELPAASIARANLPGPRNPGAPPVSEPRALGSRDLATAFEEPDDVSDISGLAVEPHLAAISDTDPLAAERYRLLAARLLNLADRRKLKTLLLTSAEAAEGKTTVALNVAWVLAKHPERRVLLIDASPTSPSVGKALGIDARRGWLNLIDRSCDLKQALIRLDPNGLYVMTPGASSAARSADIMSSRLQSLIAELTPRFEIILVDSPAILESIETQQLAEVLDGAVIVASAGHTHRSKVMAARKLIPKERRLGIVLNQSEVDTAHRRKNSLVGRLFGSKR